MTAEDLRATVIERLNTLASQEGCTNGFVEPNCVESAAPLSEWCTGCIMGRAAAVLKALTLCQVPTCGRMALPAPQPDEQKGQTS